MKPYISGEPVIIFNSDEPYCAWTMHVDGVVTYMRDDHQFVHIMKTKIGTTNNLDCRRVVRAMHIQPYTNERWAACEAWIERKRVLNEDFQKLHNGEV